MEKKNDGRIRLDLAMTEQGLAPSRERAKALINAGIVLINGQKCDKSAQLVGENDVILLKGKDIPYVGRGGLKLEKAMGTFPITLTDAICCDIGAATGGFTDCMLQNGAAKVYCVDVGYGQLAWTLRVDPRVVNLERTNIRYITEAQIPEPIDFISIDVSFISLRLVLPVAFRLLGQAGQLVCLIKPQFEAGKDKIGKKGVVRDIAIHREVVFAVTDFAVSIGFSPAGLAFSPIRGPEGNIEYLLYLTKKAQSPLPYPREVWEKIVCQSHELL